MWKQHVELDLTVRFLPDLVILTPLWRREIGQM
jgi:hypothetical protein